MWKPFISLFTRAIMLAEDLRRLREQVKEHSRQLDELADGQTSLQHEYQLERERAARERQQELREIERRFFEQRHAEDSREKELMRTQLRAMQAKIESLERLRLPAAPLEEKPDDE